MKITLAFLLAGFVALIGTSSLQAQGHHGPTNAHRSNYGNAHGSTYGHLGAQQRSYGGYSHNLYGATHVQPLRPQYAQPYQSYYSQPYQSYYAPGQVLQPHPSHYDYHAPAVQQHRFHRDVTQGHYDSH